MKVLASFLFANSVELGFASHIRRRMDPTNKKICYVFEVEDRYFKTTESVAERNALGISGRATRVWQVVEVRSFDKLDVKGSGTQILKQVCFHRTRHSEANL